VTQTEQIVKFQHDPRVGFLFRIFVWRISNGGCKIRAVKKDAA